MQITDIMQLITIANPKSILDIGVGFGKYGYLSREYLEIWTKNKNYKERMNSVTSLSPMPVASFGT